MTKLFSCREDLVKTTAVITRTGLIVQLPTPRGKTNLTEFIARTGVTVQLRTPRFRTFLTELIARTGKTVYSDERQEGKKRRLVS